MQGQILYSKGLLERLDVSSTQELFLVLQLGELEFSGVFLKLLINDDGMILKGKFNKNVQVFKIHEYKSTKAIIKYNNNNIIIDFDITNIEIENKMESLILGLGAKQYEIKTV